MTIRRLVLALAALVALAPPVWAQSSPGLIQHQVPTATQWNSYFSSKADNAQTATGSTTPRTLADRAADVFNVKDFGAKGDAGVTDDTAAINNAILAAEARLSTLDYWTPTAMPAVYLPPGNYFTSGVNIHRAIKFYGDGTGAVTLSLKAGSNRSVITLAAAPLTDPLPWAQHAQAWLSGFTVDGNSGNQTGTSNGIEFTDAPYTLATQYATSARMENISVYSPLSDAIYIGRNRNFGFMDKVIVQYAGHNCVLFSAVNDWTVSNSSFGACTFNGVALFASGAITIVNTAIYSNTQNGVDVGDSEGSYLWITGSTIGANGGHGLAIHPSTVNATAAIGLSNVHLAQNGTTTNNTSSQIYVRNFPNLTLSNVWAIYGGSGNNAKYIIDNDTTSYIPVDGLLYSTSAGAIPYATAAYANPTYIVGATNAQSGTFGLNVTLTAPQATVTNSTQFRGFSVTNGSNTVASLQGSSASNDQGALNLYNGGSLQTHIGSADQSLINNGLQLNGGLQMGSGGLRLRTRVISGAVLVADTATTSDQIIIWNGTNAANKAQAIPGCVSGISGQTLIVKDEASTATAFPITITPASGNIEGAATASIAVNKGALRLACDGVANWIAF